MICGIGNWLSSGTCWKDRIIPQQRKWLKEGLNRPVPQYQVQP